MKIPNRRELQQFVFNHSSDTDFKPSMNLCKKFNEKSYFFWLLMLLLHQMILHVSDRIFKKE